MTGALLILGGGAMAEALAAALHTKASPAEVLFDSVLIWTRRPEVSARLAERYGLTALVELSDVNDCSLQAIVLCVRDGAIAEVALQLANVWNPERFPKPPIALHTSGYHDVEVLSALVPFGIDRGVLHPCVSVGGLSASEVQTGAVFHDVRFGLSGEGAAYAYGVALAAWLGGAALRVDSARRPLYHAAAALLSCGWVAVFAEAEALLAEAMPDVPANELHALALALAKSTLANLATRTSAEALTGPVARGDDQVVRGHAHQLELSAVPERAVLYAELVAAMRRLLARDAESN
jgi:predicted short-subunit dehydrogenase-like oxidoreductase (DUF2520 family)